jgi:hypothetical protein
MLTASLLTVCWGLYSEGLSESDGWNATARLLYTTASTHVRAFLLAKFRALVEAVENQPCRAVLTRLCALFGLCDILQGEQWLGLVTAREAALAEETSHVLCAALRPDVIALTDAFDVPDRVLNSALGKEDGNVYEALLSAARSSSLNSKADGSRNRVPLFVEALRPYVNTAVLAHCNRSLPPSTMQQPAKL